MTDTITTTYICPPIPDRNHDWHAYFSWQDADDLTCEGFGETEESAVLDLLRQAHEIDQPDGEDDDLIDLALAGWQAEVSPPDVTALEDVVSWLNHVIHAHQSQADNWPEGATERIANETSIGAYTYALNEVKSRLAGAKRRATK